MRPILEHRHSFECEGHFRGNKTIAKVLQAVFYWSSLFKYAHAFVMTCDKCQRMGNISHRNAMPLKNILEVEPFDVWGIDFIGPFLYSYENQYILLAVDYISKWVEVIATPTNDGKVVLNFPKNHIFSRFGTPRAIISDGVSHFCDKPFEALLVRYEVKSRIALELNLCSNNA